MKTLIYAYFWWLSFYTFSYGSMQQAPHPLKPKYKKISAENRKLLQKRSIKQHRLDDVYTGPEKLKKISLAITEVGKNSFLLSDYVPNLIIRDKDYDQLIKIVEKNNLSHEQLNALRKENYFMQQFINHHVNTLLSTFDTMNFNYFKKNFWELSSLKNIHHHILPEKVNNSLKDYILSRAYDKITFRYECSVKHDDPILFYDICDTLNLCAIVTYSSKDDTYQLFVRNIKTKTRIAHCSITDYHILRIALSPHDSCIAYHAQEKESGKYVFLEKNYTSNILIKEWTNAPSSIDCMKYVSEGTLIAQTIASEHCTLTYELNGTLNSPVLVLTPLNSFLDTTATPNATTIYCKPENKDAKRPYEAIILQHSIPVFVFFSLIKKLKIDDKEAINDIQNAPSYRNLYETERYYLNKLIGETQTLLELKKKEK